MTFKINKEKLRAAIDSERNKSSYASISEQSGVAISTFEYILQGGGDRLPMPTYAAICHWLGVSLYHFLIMDGKELNSLISKNIENNEKTESKLQTGR